jgi:hypothetical protein
MTLCLALALAGLWAGCNLDPISGPLPETETAADVLAGKPRTIPGEIRATVPVATHVEAHATAEGCENNPGPYITLSGEILLGGVNGRLIFRNNEQGTHEHYEDDVTVDLAIVNEGEPIRFAKQPPEGGVGGNPYIWIQFYDGGWKAISAPTLLGRCVQGLRATSLDFGMLSRAQVKVTTGGCDNTGGPDITLSGEIRLGGINAKLIFTNNERGTHLRDEKTEVSIVILEAGKSITFAKQPPEGGVGGNPHIYFQFTDGDGEALSDEFYLGRCVQMGR